MKTLPFFIALLVIITISVIPAVAQTPCTPLYGGGINTDGTPFCLEAVMAATKPSALSQTNLSYTTQNTQTKGGLTVQPLAAMTKQPSTGPEMLGLLGLIPTALIGLKLRKTA